MADARAASLRLLAEHGRLLRHNRHAVYDFFGRRVTITNTRTDFRGWRNKLCELRRIQREVCIQE
ncbi:hypothetical protein [Cupriavidus necator]